MIARRPTWSLALIHPTDEALRTSPDGVLIDVWAVPGARTDAIAGMHNGALKIRISQPPEGGKANRRIASLVGSMFGVRRPRLVAGATSRRKTFLLTGIDLSQAVVVLRAAISAPETGYGE